MKIDSIPVASVSRSALAAITMAAGVILSLATSGTAQQHYIIDADQTTTFGDPLPVLAVGDSVTILEGGSIIVTGSSGIVFQGLGSNEILNLGHVEALGAAGRAIQLRSSPNSSITNAGTVISGDRALYAFQSANSILTNRGQVTTTDGGIGLFAWFSADSTLVNQGTVTTSDFGAHGMQATDSRNARLLNTGSIATNAEDAYGMSVLRSDGSSLHNRGTIHTGGVEWSDGMAARDSFSTGMTNDGAITVPGSGASGMAIYNSASSRLINNGTIDMVGANGAEPAGLSGIFVHDSSNDSIVENNGTINVSGSAQAFEIVDSLGVVTHNRGVVTASGPDAIGYRTAVPSTLINSGTIFAGSPAAKAIVFAGTETADTLHLLAGTRLQGTIDLGGGADAVTLDRTGDSVGWRFTLDNLDDTAGTLVVAGGHYAVERSGGKTTVTITDVSPHEGASPKLAMLATGLGQGVLDQLTLRGSEHTATLWGAALGANLDASRFGGTIFGADIGTPDGALRLGIFAGAGQSAIAGTGFGYQTGEVYGGLYGRLTGEDRYFADLMLLGGHGQGTSETRQIANNLVPGGIETVVGGDNSGTYAAVRARVGTAIPLTFGMLVPALTLGYAQETRQGYVEAGAGGMAVRDHTAKMLDARFSLTALIEQDAWGGRLQLGASGGLDLAMDLSDPVVFEMAGANFALPGHNGTTRGNWFVGGSVNLGLSETLSFKATAELLANAWNSGSGARVSLELAGTF